MDKVVVFGIIILFIGLSFIPSTASNIAIEKSSKTTIVTGDPPLPPLMWTEDFLTFYILIVDPDGDDIWILIDWGDGSPGEWLGPFESGEIVSFSHIWDEEGTYQFKLKARDWDGESPKAVYSLTLSSDFKFFHPSLGYVGITYKFTIYLEDYGLHMFDWGDGTYSDWVIGIADKSYSSPGVYEIKWKAKDMYGNETPWSDPILITILIIGNQPPTAPYVTGPKIGIAGVKYEWTFVSTDPEEDNITYYIDFGDQCGGAEYYGPNPSGEQIIIPHIYPYRSTFIINALAIDEFGTQSNWTYYEVTMPRIKMLHNSLFLQLLERFPFLQTLFNVVGRYN